MKLRAYVWLLHRVRTTDLQTVTLVGNHRAWIARVANGWAYSAGLGGSSAVMVVVVVAWAGWFAKDI